MSAYREIAIGLDVAAMRDDEGLDDLCLHLKLTAEAWLDRAGEEVLAVKAGEKQRPGRHPIKIETKLGTFHMHETAGGHLDVIYYPHTETGTTGFSMAVCVLPLSANRLQLRPRTWRTDD